MILSVQVSFDAAFRCFFELRLANFNLRNLLVCRQHFVQLVAVLLHNVTDILIVESHVLGLVVVGINQSDEFVVALNDDALDNMTDEERSPEATQLYADQIDNL